MITTATFTPSARSFAAGKPITLLAGTDILRWSSAYQKSQEGTRRTATVSSSTHMLC
ncbi:MAG: restriction endonuclease [Acidobacteriia bacterium]|nr:restriction endonuclease [Terriglobia bacterium]